MSSVRCKMKLVSKTEFENGKFRYNFEAVCADEVPENQRFHRYTPNGKFEIDVTNPNVNYVVGQCYYFDSTPVPTPA